MDYALALGIIGTITGITSLSITLWKTTKEKPIVEISDGLLMLEKKDGDKAVGRLSFNLDNIGDKSTTVRRVTVMFGDHVEVIEGLRNLPSHSSIRYPEKKEDMSLFTGLKELSNLRIIIMYTHKTIEKIYSIPPESEWEKRALYKGGAMALDLDKLIQNAEKL